MLGGAKENTTARARGNASRFKLLMWKSTGIIWKAIEVRVSRSSYLRALSLNTSIRSVVDLNAVADVGKLMVTLDWSAELMKNWLLEKRGQGSRTGNGESIMNGFCGF